MIDYLRRVRLTWRQLGVVATLSALATGLVIFSALGHGSTPSAVIAALSRQVVVHRHTAPASTPAADPSPMPSPGADDASGGSTVGGSAGGGSSGTTSGAGSGSAGASTDSAAGGGSGPNPDGSASQPTKTPTARSYKVKHVFVIALSSPGYQAVFGRASQTPYLDGTLKRKGTLLSGYETLGGAELPDYLAMVSGQAPNPDTRRQCASYVDFPPSAKPNTEGLMSGSGCVYPNTVLSIGDQVTAGGADWKAYIGDMGTTPCIHPNSDALDDQVLPFAGSEYDTRHNPFIYFHSLLDLGDCSTDDLSLTALPKALKSHTPEYTFIAPDACADAASSGCSAGAPSGLAAEDAFLKTWVPKILASPAYRKDGVLVITFGAATPSTTTTTTPAATTTTPATTTTTPATTTTTTTTPATTTTTPATPMPTATTPTSQTATPSASPVRVGALVLSRFAAAGKTVSARYDAYSLLRSIEDLLGLKPLGHAAGAKTFIATALPGA